MRFDDRFLEELKSRLRPSDVIGKSVKLRRQGREYAGLSPFTKERSPSFFVNDDKGFFHDFSSGKHGDIISYLQETERLTFSEAVERLASEAGMALPEPDVRAAQEDKKRQGLGPVWQAIADAHASATRKMPTPVLTRLLQDYALAEPRLVSLRSIGKSYEGRDIWLAVVTQSATGVDNDKPAFWADGNIHAAELTASTACLYWLHALVTGYGTAGVSFSTSGEPSGDSVNIDDECGAMVPAGWVRALNSTAAIDPLLAFSRLATGAVAALTLTTLPFVSVPLTVALV